MGTRKFSVGKILVDTVAVGVATSIAVKHEGNVQEFRGGDYRFPLDIVPGDQTLSVTADTADFDATPPAIGTSVTLELQSGASGGGLVITLTDMVLISSEVSSSQNGFVATKLEWRKKDIEV